MKFVAKTHSLLAAKFALYSLQKLLDAKSHTLLVAKFVHYLLQKLLIAKFACYSLEMLLLAKKLFVIRYKENLGTNVDLKPIKIGEFYFIFYLKLTKNRERFHIQKYSIAKI